MTIREKLQAEIDEGIKINRHLLGVAEADFTVQSSAMYEAWMFLTVAMLESWSADALHAMIDEELAK